MNPETIEKLNHLPEKSRKALVEFADRIAESFNGNLYSLMLFGSAAGGDFIEGKSDINTIIILHSVRCSDLNIIMEVGKKFAKAGLAVPLVFEKGHVPASLDTFPLEFSDMKQRHILLWGEDPLAEVTIERKNLRYQCERELKSLLVNLRRGFLRAGGKKENLESLLNDSFSSALAACRGLIWMTGKTPPDSVSDLLAAISAEYNCDLKALEQVWLLRKGKSGATATLESLFDDYAASLAELASTVDKL